MQILYESTILCKFVINRIVVYLRTHAIFMYSYLVLRMHIKLTFTNKHLKKIRRTVYSKSKER